MVKASLIRFWIRVGDRDHIEEWLCRCGLTPDDSIRYLQEAQYTALAKILIWQGRTEKALKVLTQLHDLAQNQGRNGKLLFVLALQSLALKQSGDLDNALRALECSLRLAQSEGIIRPYVDEGKPMEELLKLGAERGLWDQTHLGGTVSRLLKAIRQDQVRLEGF